MFARSAQRLFSHAIRRLAVSRSAVPRVRPRLEVLEDRLAPAVVTVNTTSDDESGGTVFSLRRAINFINSKNEASNTINFLPGMSDSIRLTADLPTIKVPVVIQGPGAPIEIDGQGMFTPFTIDDGNAGSSISVTIRDLTIRNAARNGDGGALYNENENVTLQRVIFENNFATFSGGAIFSNGGNLKIEDSILQDNVAELFGGAVRIVGGSANVSRTRFLRNTALFDSGAFDFDGGTLVVNESSFNANTAIFGDGGAFYVRTSVTISNSSFTENFAGNNGGAFHLPLATSNLTLKNATISKNFADSDGGGISFLNGQLNIFNSTIAKNSGFFGGGLFINPDTGIQARLVSTILAQNEAVFAPDVFGKLIDTTQNSLIGNSEGLTGNVSNDTNGNQVGTPAVPLDPQLQPLQYVGIVRVHPLLPTSPAIDAGDNSANLSSDGRGGPFTRVFGDKADVGAFESQPNVTLTVTNPTDRNNAGFNPADLTLREALRFAGAGAPKITFAPALTGKTITLTQGPLFVSGAVTIEGPGADKLTIDANNRDTAIIVFDFDFTTNVQVTIKGLTIQNGQSGPGSLDAFGGGFKGVGGGIVSLEQLTLSGVTLQNNNSIISGGGALILLGSLKAENSAILNNNASFVGGGVAAIGGNLTLRNTTVSGNSANFDGGGVYFDFLGSLTVRNSTVAFNTSDSGFGGGIRILESKSTDITSAIIARNSVGAGGFHPDISGKANARSSLIENSNGFDPDALSDPATLIFAEDPRLGPLAFNGGPTKTHALMAGSPAINTGANPDNLTTDQRGAGFARVIGSQADMGAFEFNSPPTLAPIGPQTTTEGKAIAVALTVGDAETPASKLVVTATSNNQTLVSNAKLVVTGTGANRTLTITPTAGQVGTAQITVTVRDEGALTASRTFTLTVTDATPPTISNIANPPAVQIGQVIGPLPFTIGDNVTPAAQLTVTAKSSNLTLVPNANLTLGGSGANRTITVTPAAGQSGTAQITVTVRDAAGNSTARSFTVTVNAPSDTTPPVITPSTLPNITVTVGQTIAPVSITVSDNVTPAGSITVTATSNNAGVVGVAVSGSGSNRTITLIPVAGQTGTAQITVTARDAAGNSTARSFTVTINPQQPPPQNPPTISPIANPAPVLVNTPIGPLPFTIGDAETPAGQLILSANSSNTVLVPVGNITFGGSGANRTVMVMPAAGQSGTAVITITVRDTDGNTASESFSVVVNQPDPTDTIPPTISVISNPAPVQVNTPIGPLAFVIGDNLTPADALQLTASSNNPTLVPNNNIVFGGSGVNRTVTVTPAAGQTGTAVITITVRDAQQNTATRSFTVTVVSDNPTALVGVTMSAVGADRGSGQVVMFNPDMSVRFNVSPFGAFTGGVRTATADFNGDGVPDVVVGTGPGIATRVLILDGATQSVLFSVDPFEPSFTGGVYVAAGDLNGDGIPDLVITPDEGGGPRCRVFDGANFGVMADFFGIEDPNFRGGARAAIGDVNGDGAGDLIVAAGFGGGPRIAGFSGRSLAGGPVKIFGDFFMFEQTLRNGVFIAAGDLNGDGHADIIAGGGPGGGPRVFALSGKGLINGNQEIQMANFFGGDPDSRGGIRIVVKDLDGDNRADIMVGAGEGAGSRVTTYLGKTIPTNGPPPAQNDFNAFPGFTGGVFVG